MIEVKVDNRADFGPVRNQNPLPTCLAHATSTAHRKVRGLNDRLSAETLHFHANGGDLESALSVNQLQVALRNEGQPKKVHCDPIPTDDPGTWSPPQNVRHFKSDSENHDWEMQEVVELISKSYSPVLGITFPREFYEPEAPWIMREGEPVGRHAVLGIGYGDYDNGTAVLIRNSWGVDWGDSGHVWLAPSFIKSHLEDVFVITEGHAS
jgi:C1A family cysteine protease